MPSLRNCPKERSRAVIWGTKRTSSIRRYFTLIFLFWTIVCCNSTAPAPSISNGLAGDAVFAFRGFLKGKKDTKSENTGEKWEEAPESSIQRFWATCISKPLHLIQLAIGQVHENLFKSTLS